MLQPAKCSFCKLNFEILEFITTKDGLKPNLKKVKVIQNYLLLTTPKEVERFLEMVTWLKRFIPCSSSLTTHLKKSLISISTLLEGYSNSQLSLTSREVKGWAELSFLRIWVVFSFLTKVCNFQSFLKRWASLCLFFHRAVNLQASNFILSKQITESLTE